MESYLDIEEWSKKVTVISEFCGSNSLRDGERGERWRGMGQKN